MPVGKTVHDLKAQIRALQLCLTADKRPLGFLLGAGCPLAIRVGVGDTSAPLIPDIKGLTKLVRQKIEAEAEHKPVLVALDAVCTEDAILEPTVEDYLNRLRNIHAVGGKSPVRGIAPEQAQKTDRRICQFIKAEVDKPLLNMSSPYHTLARWIRGISRVAPVEIFTPNYDMLFEQSFEESGIPYFDGFAGARRAFLDVEAMENGSLPSRWARLWKLHGSVNWRRDKNGNVWRGVDSGDDDLLIYPSHHKYSQSRRMPFLAMMDRLKAFLNQPEAILVVCGYSFVDEHFNALLRDGLRGNARVAVFGLVFGNLDSSHPATPLAEEAPNFLLMGRDAAVIGGNRGEWGVPQGESSAPEFLLGDFVRLGEFLSTISGQPSSPSPDNAK